MVRADDAATGRLEEKFRPFRRVHAVIKCASACILRLFYARVAAAVVGDARGPDFLPHNGCEDRCGIKMLCRFPARSIAHIGMHVLSGDEFVPSRCLHGEEASLFLHKNPTRCSIKLHATAFLLCSHLKTRAFSTVTIDDVLRIGYSQDT